MYNCELCGSPINTKEYDRLDDAATTDIEKIICDKCVKKFTNAKVIAKVGKAALVMITWEDDDASSHEGKPA